MKIQLALLSIYGIVDIPYVATEKGILVFLFVCLVQYYHIVFLALFITGGPTNSVETWRPSDGASCSLPRMTMSRSSHTISGGLACGDIFMNTSCEVWRADAGYWEVVVSNLTEERWAHVAWTEPEGTTFLIGGHDGYGQSVETISKDYTVSPASFSLEHDRA